MNLALALLVTVMGLPPFKTLPGMVILNGTVAAAWGVPPKVKRMVFPDMAVAVTVSPAGRFVNQPAASAVKGFTVSLARVMVAV